MLILSSPSGAGKTTVARMLLKRDRKLDMSVSVTTRPRRQSEQDGLDYRFVDHAQFGHLVASGGMLEHAIVFGHRYGTPKSPVESAITNRRDMLFDIDWQGSRGLGQHSHLSLVRVFILPPSLAELKQRLTMRSQNSQQEIAARLEAAEREVSFWAEYDYVVVNQRLEDTVDSVYAILQAERLRRVRQQGLSSFVSELVSHR